MEQKYSKIVNREKKQAEIILFGVIGEKVDGHYFAKELNWLGRNYDEITIKINSEGGDMVQGLSIVSEIRSSLAHITTIVVGVAASMAGVIAVAGDKVVMNDYAQIMLHSPYYVDSKGNKVSKLSAKDKKALAAMKAILVSILTVSGKEKDAIDKILTDETWYDADTAVSEGFASEVVDTKRKDLAALQPLKLVAKVMEELDKEIPENSNSNSNKKTMKKIAARLGLAVNATEEQIVAELEKRETAALNAMVAQFLVLGEKLGTITKENKEKAERLAKADMEIAIENYLAVEVDGGEEKDKGVLIKDLLSKDVKSKAGKAAAVLAAKKWEDLSEEEVETLREKDVKAYTAKFKAYYGFAPEVED